MRTLSLGTGGADKGGSSGGGVISVLGDMLAAAAAFVAGLAEALAREGVPDLGDLPAAAYAPFQAQLDRCASPVVSLLVHLWKSCA